MPTVQGDKTASEFVVNQAYRAGWKSGEMEQRCPVPGFSAPTFRFKVVRGKRQAAV